LIAIIPDCLHFTRRLTTWNIVPVVSWIFQLLPSVLKWNSMDPQQIQTCSNLASVIGSFWKWV